MIHLLCTSDIHGNLFNEDVALNQDKAFGLSSLPSCLSSFNQQTTLLIDNGDCLQGSAFATYLHTQQTQHSIATAFNACGYHYVNLGNHDFNYGKDVLFSFLKQLNAPCITGNVLYEGNPLGQSVIHTINHHRIGIIGAVTDYIPHWEKPDHIKGFEFLDVVSYVKSEVDRLRPHVDTCVVVYHGGFERDLHSGEPTERISGENVGYELAHIQGIDVLFTGHQHRSILTEVDATICLQCGFEGSELMHVQIDHNGLKAELIPLHHFEKTTHIQSLYADIMPSFIHWLNTPCGSLDADRYQLTDDLMSRLIKPPLISLFNQIMMERTQAMLASSSLFNTLVGLPQHPTIKDLISAYPYPNVVVVKALNKATLYAYLEQNAAFFSLDEQSNIIIDPSFVFPKKQLYNYDMIDGVEVIYDISQPIGSRVVSCTYNGYPLDENTIYTCAMNNYRAVGGGDFEMIAKAPTIFDTGDDMMTLLVNTLTSQDITMVHHRNNITIFASETMKPKM